MTIVAEAHPGAAHRVRASLYKLDNVLEVDDVAQLSCVVRELALIKVAADCENPLANLQLAEVFRARVARPRARIAP